MEEFSISGIPIVDGDGRLVGIITNRDLVFEKDLGADTEKVAAAITAYDPDVTWEPVEDPSS
jgi:IMP dehydrogenase